MANAFRLFHSAIPFSDRDGGILHYDTIREYPGFAYDKLLRLGGKLGVRQGLGECRSILVPMVTISHWIMCGGCRALLVRSAPLKTKDR